MARDVTLRIIAQDLASKVFKQVGDSAAASANQAEQANQKAARSYEDVEKRAKAVGAAIGVVAAGLSYANQTATDHARVIDSVGRVYKDQADEIMGFSKELQNNTNISDEAARKAALTASTLQKSYGLTTDEIEKLIERSADLAQVTGRDLSDVIERTSSAIRGEGEAAEALAITLSDSYVASQAAARGLTGWNTTMSDSEKAAFRLSLLLEQTSDSTGAAADAAQGMRGNVIDLTQSLEDSIVKFGEWTGGMGEALGALGNMALLLPVVGGGLGKLFAGLGAVGLGGGVLGPLALGAGAAYIGTQAIKDSSQAGTSMPLDVWNGFFGSASGVMNAVLPGNPYDTSRYSIAQGANEAEDVLKNLFFMDPLSINPNDSDFAKALFDRLITFGIVQPNSGMSQDEQLIQLQSRASDSGMSLDQYIEAYLTASGSTAVLDPVTRKYMDLGEFQIYNQERTINRSSLIQDTATSYVGSPGTSGLERAAPSPSPADNPTLGTYRTSIGTYAPREFGENSIIAHGDDVATSMTAMGNASVAAETQIRAVTAALIAQYPAYEGLITGINSANDAQSAFSGTQQIIMEQESIYGGQISEYTSQVNAQDAAYEILNTRREEGQSLNQAELDFLDNYATANERGTGAIEDATVAQGMLAQQYLLNMQQGDALNQTLAGTNEATSGLTRTIQDLILMMEGVPDEVRTQILLDRADESIADLIAYYNWLSSLPSHVTTVVETQFIVTGNDGDHRLRGSGSAGMNGLTVGYSDGGTVHAPLMPAFANGGTWAMVGERGPEVVYLSRGDQVFNTEASKSMTSRERMRDRGMHLHGPVYIYPDTADIQREITSAIVGAWRS